MFTIHQIAFYLHVAVGSCALILFWVPVFTRKGNLDHKKFGRYFSRAMYIVAISGLTMSSLDLAFPLATHAAELNLGAEEARGATAEIRTFALFLFSLSILVLTNTRQGWLSIKGKTDRSALRNPVHVALCSALVLVGLVLFANGLRVGSTLFLIFGALQVASGIGSLRYNFKSELKDKEWWIDHLRGLIGSGIGAYTAFLVFGGRQLFEGIFGSVYGNVSILLWVAPGVIGAIAISLSSAHYKAKFGGDWAVKHAKLRTNLFQ
ncbi:MAG: hypothetical protein HOF74_01875 [Gammaproteobacteria bacterium]|jgi:uncharacterized membrane protein HdeD (DUF308 family)|nr:hypothetical protein [Gammaproteobacteria bacterium]MBT3858557.1 hypothetical protein [Gammaproteobacteria bacterium]MBT3986705.1 hypothetical protein [Gammaproteobacteria bacterium]MBT4582801.1 hypothetical protein [Gammaproteobacteria bacterium]MBT4657524.1 hypothetical protein [Gammaproteobacteria bacterium]